jgi:hypothetical protein
MAGGQGARARTLDSLGSCVLFPLVRGGGGQVPQGGHGEGRSVRGEAERPGRVACSPSYRVGLGLALRRAWPCLEPTAPLSPRYHRLTETNLRSHFRLCLFLILYETTTRTSSRRLELPPTAGAEKRYRERSP